VEILTGIVSTLAVPPNGQMMAVQMIALASGVADITERQSDQQAGQHGATDLWVGADRAGRTVCARCGSTLTCEGESSPEMHCHFGAFDDADRLKPTRHIFPDERLPWLPTAEA
jgi:hypothetical protein